MLRVRRKPDPKSQPVRITTAPESPGKDLSHRQRRYVISMGIRTLCFIGAVAAQGSWLTWVLIGAAFVLPYVAVVMANAASPQVPGTDLQDPGQQRRELGPGPVSGVNGSPRPEAHHADEATHTGRDPGSAADR